MESVDEVGEPEPGRDLRQLHIIHFAAVTRPAGIQEPAHGRRALPVLCLEVLADGSGIRDRKVIQRNECLLLPAQLQQHPP
jgi:hypothetical protein